MNRAHAGSPATGEQMGLEAQMPKDIKVDHVSYEYSTEQGRVLAVKDVSFALAESGFLCIVGPSGCGKTTILNILAGFLRPTQGSVLIEGAPLGGGGENQGVVFQDFAQLFPWRTVQRNVEFGLEMRKVNRKARAQAATRYLNMVHLGNFANAYPHQLSGGMQQRAAIARALAYNPSVLLMDEPFAALDAMTRDEMQRMLYEIWRDTKKTIVYITHNVAEAVYLADDVLVMAPHPGAVKAHLSIAMARPRDPLSADFIEIQKKILDMLGATPARKETNHAESSS